MTLQHANLFSATDISSITDSLTQLCAVVCFITTGAPLSFVCVLMCYMSLCVGTRVCVCVLFSLCISVCVCFTAARDGGLMSFKRALFYPLMSIRTPRGLGGPAHHRRRKQPPSQPPFLALISNTHPRITVNNSHSKLSQITSLLA